MRISCKLLFVLMIVGILLAGLPACSSQQKAGLQMAPLHEMPAEVQSSPVSVQEAYQFNVANPDVMQSIPCYCGCGGIGHTSNYDCYVSSVNAQGAVTFDNHALGCSICVDITQDVMRMLEDGKTPQEARAYIDSTYSKYGPSNIP